MSITHSLKFESQFSSKFLLNFLLSSHIGLQAGQYDQMKTEGRGLYGRVVEVEMFSKKSLFNEFGIDVNVSVIFDENSDGDVKEGKSTMGKAVALLLYQEKGDAVFFYVSDTPVLKRANGQLEVINEPEFDWLRNALNEKNLHYKLESADNIRKLVN